MNQYREIDGDLIRLSLEGKFDVVVHGCNCFCIMGAGIAPQMAKAFGADKFEMEADEYRGDINKLGTIDYEIKYLEDGKIVNYPDENGKWVTNQITVVNAYSQYGFGNNHVDGIKIPLDYHALILCFKKINHIFSGKKVGFPKIGCGLAGGDWNTVKDLMKTFMPDIQIFIVNYKPNKTI